mgnify:CR=1 FL=1
MTGLLGFGQNLPAYNVFSLDSINMKYTVQRPFDSTYATGFNFMMMAAQIDIPRDFNTFSVWQQAPLNIPGTANNVFKKGRISYFFKPFGYLDDFATPLFDFHRLFPTFTLPQGRLMVLESGVGRRDFYNNTFNTSTGYAPLVFDRQAHLAMLQRGVTHVKDLQDTNPQNTMKFLGDAWLLAVNYPSDGYNPLPDHLDRVLLWSQTQSVQSIFDYWVVVHLSDPNSSEFIGNISYYLWDFELNWAWPIVAAAHFKAFMDLLYDYIEVNYPNLLIAIWRKSAYKVRNFSDTVNLYDVFNYLNTNTITPAQAKTYLDSTIIAANDGFTYTEGLYDTKGVQQVGFYQTFLRSRENPAYYLLEYIINKKVSPESKVLLIYWSDIETVIGCDFKLSNVVLTLNGNTRTIPVKPRVGNSAMQSLAIWSMAFGDGADLWEIVRWNDDPREWNFLDPVPGNVLPNSYPYSSLKGVNWFMAGVWAVSENKDIVEANTPWNFVNNSAWVLFSNAEFQDPLIAWKLSSDGTKAMVLISDFTRRLPELRDHTININGNNYTVQTYYRFTSVARIDLLVH